MIHRRKRRGVGARGGACVSPSVISEIVCQDKMLYNTLTHEPLHTQTTQTLSLSQFSQHKPATTTTNINSNPPSSYPLSGTCLFNSLTLSHSCPFCYSSGFLTCLIFRRALQWSFITSKAFQVASTTLTPLKFWPNVLREETAIDDVIRGVRPAILRYSYRDAETNQSTTSLVTAAFS